MSGSLDVWVLGSTGVQLPGCPDAWMSGCLGARILGPPDARMSGCLNVWLLGARTWPGLVGWTAFTQLRASAVRCRACLALSGSVDLCNADTNGLWSVKTWK